MKPKMLLLCALLSFPAAPLSQAEDKAPFLPSLSQNPVTQNLLPFQPMEDCTANYMRGDFNESGFWDIDDAAHMINCVFVDPRGGLCLPCIVDINCDNRPTPVDMVLLLRFIIQRPIFEVKCPG
ncbi:MAG: hypothetical protein L0209_10275 [candidate division Zixibacteria bacterium]|nr:hypothetical protein [candidate division Zixibacteria bacterium]